MDIKSVLTEYADMKEEIKDLRRRIAEDRKALNKLGKTIDSLNETVVTDSVTCGKKGRKPLKVVKIQDRPMISITHKWEVYERKRKALEHKLELLEELETDLLEKQNQVEEYILQIEKSRIRTMFRFYYIDGLTWEMTATKMNYLFPKKRIPFTKDSCRKLHDRFLEKVS